MIVSLFEIALFEYAMYFGNFFDGLIKALYFVINIRQKYQPEKWVLL